MQLSQNFGSFRIYVLTTLEAALAGLCYMVPIAAAMPDDFLLYMELEGGWLRIGIIAATYVLATYPADLFRNIQVRSRLTVALQLFQLLGLILLMQAVLGFLNPELILPPNIGILGSGVAALVILPWRLFVRPALWNAFGAQKVLLAGTGRGVQELAQAFRNEPILNVEVLGSVVLDPDDATVHPVLGTLSEFRQVVATEMPRLIIVSTEITDKAFLRDLLAVKSAGITVRTVGQSWEMLFGRLYSYDLAPDAVVYRKEVDARPTSLALQSIYNNLLGLAAIVIALPILLIIATWLRVTRSGPVLSKVQCVGLHAIPFTMYRFRLTSGNDLMTRILRRFRLEGLPQILNIVRGEIALIGPRAERMEFDDALTELLPFYQQRHHVKPGIFGWSQLHCDSMNQEDTLMRVEYDLYYIKHISLLVDAHVVVRALRWLISEPQGAGLRR